MTLSELITLLDNAFRGRSRLPSDCISFDSEAELYITDSESSGNCVFVKSQHNSSHLFKIINSNNHQIALWAVDGCFFKRGSSDERCDCIFFSDSEFCFAEFKFNSSSTSLLTISQNRDKAISQLRSMITLLHIKSGTYPFSQFNCEAYLCTPETYPRKNTAISKYAIEFAENYNISLYEQNHKTFN